MIGRLILSTIGAAMTTAVIILGMQGLIAVSENVVVEPPPIKPWLLPRLPDTEVRVQEKPPEKEWIKPMDPPPLITDETSIAGPLNVFVPPTPLPGGPVFDAGVSSGDTPLLTVMRATPQYPIRLEQAGVEGWVDVMFDVAASGEVVNVVVIASSHKGFEKLCSKPLFV